MATESVEELRKHKKFSYFLGCLTPNRYPGVEAATIKVMKHFGLELVDLPAATCCPAPGVFGSFDLPTWVTIAARNVSISEGLDENGLPITVTCNGCYGSLQETIHLLHDNEELKDQVNETLTKIGKEFKGTVNVYHTIEKLRVFS